MATSAQHSNRASKTIEQERLNLSELFADVCVLWRSGSTTRWLAFLGLAPHVFLRCTPSELSFTVLMWGAFEREHASCLRVNGVLQVGTMFCVYVSSRVSIGVLDSPCQVSETSLCIATHW